MVRLWGGVEIRQGERRITADRAAFDRAHDRIHVAGQVLMESPGIRLAGVIRSLFEDTGADLLSFAPLAADGAALPEDCAALLDGHALPAAEAPTCVVTATPHLPQVSLRLPGSTAAAPEVVLPARLAAVPPSRVVGHCRVGHLPPVLSAAYDRFMAG